MIPDPFQPAAKPPTPRELDAWRAFFERVLTPELMYDMLWDAFANPFVRLRIPYNPTARTQSQCYHCLASLGVPFGQNPFRIPAPKLLTYEPIS